MTCTTQILVALLIGCAAREFSFNQSEDLASARHQYGISALVTQTSFARAQVATSRNVGCFLRLILVVCTDIVDLLVKIRGNGSSSSRGIPKYSNTSSQFGGGGGGGG